MIQSQSASVVADQEKKRSMSGPSDKKAAWVLAVLGIDIGRTTISDSAAKLSPADAMAGWKAARAKAITSLKTLEGAIAKAGLVDSTKAIILIKAICANLSEEPATPQQIAELQRYLEDDDIIEEAESPNGYGIQISLRDPLLDALDELEDAIAP